MAAGSHETPPALAAEEQPALFPRWWRLLILAISVLVLCSCCNVPTQDGRWLSAQPKAQAAADDQQLFLQGPAAPPTSGPGGSTPASPGPAADDQQLSLQGPADPPTSGPGGSKPASPGPAANDQGLSARGAPTAEPTGQQTTQRTVAAATTNDQPLATAGEIPAAEGQREGAQVNYLEWVSVHGPARSAASGGACVTPPIDGPPATLPDSAWTGPDSAWTGAPPWDASGAAEEMPAGPQASWSPPGIARPWPRDEYIGDGGQQGPPSFVDAHWQIHGLAPEDTIAHYDTLDGRTVVEPSNHVMIYAPKFAAVRRVSSVNSYDQNLRAAGIHDLTQAAVQQEKLPARTVLQPVAARGEVGQKRLTIQQQNNPPLLVESDLRATEIANRLKPYEDFTVIRTGQLQEAQRPILAQRVQAAIGWTRDQGAQVILDNKIASVATGDRRAQATYTFAHNTSPRLRLLKLASTDTGRPGDLVEFTLRYDNTGTEVIGNVTIVDNLTTRLEYVPNSATSTRRAKFATQENDSGSLVLRWEIAEPLKPDEGGVLRFQCRLR